MEFRFRIEVILVMVRRRILWKEPRVKFGVRFLPSFFCLFSPKIGRSRIGRVKCGFASPVRRGSQTVCVCVGGRTGGSRVGAQ